MEFAVRHFMAGRLRLFVPALRRRRSVAEAALGWLRGQPGIQRARINYECASLVVAFDPAHEPLLRALLGRLALMSIDDLRTLVQHTPAHAQRTSSERSVIRSVPTIGARACGSAGIADRLSGLVVYRQSNCSSHQSAVDALERLPDRAPRLGRLAP